MTYEHIPFIPGVIARCVTEQPYIGQDMSIQIRSAAHVATVEGLRQKMTPAAVDEFVDLTDRMCRTAFEAGADWFMKCVRSRTNTGRDQMYIWAAHWLSGFLVDPVGFRRMAA